MFSCLGGRQNFGESESGLRIQLRSSPNFNPGETVIGQVVLSNNRPKEVKSIRIKFIGKARVHWTETKGHGRRSYTSHIVAEELYFVDETNLLGNDNVETTLPPGSHSYTFAYTLPPGIPSSFSNQVGNVTYSIEVVMKRSWYKRDQTISLPFVIQGALNLNYVSGISSPVQVEKGKLLCSLFPCKMGQVYFKFHLEKRGFVPGERITYRAEVNNESGYKLKRPKIKLVKVITFHADGKTKTEIGVIDKVKGDQGIGAGSKFVLVDQGALKVPQVPPSRLGGCRIIDVQYQLRFEVKLPLLWKNSWREIPLTIGTVPIIDTTSGNYYGAAPTFGNHIGALGGFQNSVATPWSGAGQNWQYFPTAPQTDDCRNSLNPSPNYNRYYPSPINESHSAPLLPFDGYDLRQVAGSGRSDVDDDIDDCETLPPTYEESIQMKRFTRVNYSED